MPEADAQHKLDIVIVDYLQLMSGPDNAAAVNRR
jgi:replicative DNA helicase